MRCRRYGYQRLHVMLRREGYRVNHKKTYRLYRQEQLTVRQRRGRRRIAARRMPMPRADQVNRRWSMEFVAEQLMDGRRFRLLTVVDDCTRECRGILVEFSMGGLRVSRFLDDLIRIHGRPTALLTDNGSEFTSRAMFHWVHQHAIDLCFIEPGKPS